MVRPTDWTSRPAPSTVLQAASTKVLVAIAIITNFFILALLARDGKLMRPALMPINAKPCFRFRGRDEATRPCGGASAIGFGGKNLSPEGATGGGRVCAFRAHCVG